MLPREMLGKRIAALLLLVFGALLSAAFAQTESVLYSFCSQPTCTDGARPAGGVLFDQSGNLYGTTVGGGANGSGVVFKVTPQGSETVLYSFCGQQNCPDGNIPNAGLVFDQSGNLYGTTVRGGANGSGVVFKVTPQGAETVLYSFCGQQTCTDGAKPSGGVLFDQSGNLYGTTGAGGANGSGVVFKLTPQGNETALYSFCAQKHCADGNIPSAGLVFDKTGNLYGATLRGGAYGSGAVFKITPQGKQTVLYSFCAQNKCTHGARPVAVALRKGALYGATENGGAHNYHGGVLFKLTRSGKETLVYSFCAQTNCADGASPSGSVLFDQSGNSYGTTSAGGANGSGVAFKVTPQGSEAVLYSFCGQPNCPDGNVPNAGLVSDQSGNLYGTTLRGGANGSGVVFKITP